MEKEKLIKSLKSASKKQKKVYMLEDVEPDVEVTGGLTGIEGFNLDKMKEA